MPNGAMLPAGTTASRQRGIDWRADVKRAAIEAMGERRPTDQPIRLTCEFALPYPKSSVRKYQLGWLPNVKKPDIDKLLRELLDAMTGIVWVDDNQVCYVTVNKVYAWDDRPGANVNAEFLTNDFLQRVGKSRMILLQAMDRMGVDAV